MLMLVSMPISAHRTGHGVRIPGGTSCPYALLPAARTPSCAPAMRATHPAQRMHSKKLPYNEHTTHPVRTYASTALQAIRIRSRNHTHLQLNSIPRTNTRSHASNITEHAQPRRNTRRTRRCNQYQYQSRQPAPADPRNPPRRPHSAAAAPRSRTRAPAPARPPDGDSLAPARPPLPPRATPRPSPRPRGRAVARRRHRARSSGRSLTRRRRR